MDVWNRYQCFQARSSVIGTRRGTHSFDFCEANKYTLCLDRSHRTLLPASKAAQAWHKSSSFLSIFTILVILRILCSLSPSAPDHGHKANAEKRSRKAGQVHADVPRLHGFRVRGQLPTFGLISRRACMEMPGRPFTTSRSGAKQDPPPHPETPRPQSSLLLAQAHFLHLSTFSRQEGVRDRMGRLFRAALLAANYDSWQLSAIQDLPFCLISTDSDPSHLDNSEESANWAKTCGKFLSAIQTRISGSRSAQTAQVYRIVWWNLHQQTAAKIREICLHLALQMV